MALLQDKDNSFCKNFFKKYNGAIYFVASVLFLTLVVSLILPRTYKSESVIQIGEIQSELGSTTLVKPESYSLAESKNIILGSSVLLPVEDQFYPKKDIDLKKFIKKHVMVDIISERGSVAELLKTNYIRITTFAKTPKATLEMNRKILSNFFNYTSLEYTTNVELVEKEISLREARILKMENQVDELTKGILNTKQSTSTTETQIIGEYLKAISLEQSELYKLKEKIATKKDYKVISEPQLPIKQYRPNILLNVGVAFALSILVLFFIILSDFLKKQD